MLHRSDNFFAEQTLLMASNEFLGYMNEKDIIDTLLKKNSASFHKNLIGLMAADLAGTTFLLQIILCLFWKNYIRSMDWKE